MEPTPLPALRRGTVPGWRYDHDVIDLGGLRMPTGVLEVCDPFTELGRGLRVQLPPREHPVRLTVAHVPDGPLGSGGLHSYLSVVLGEGEPATVRPLAVGDDAARPEPAGDRPGVVTVESGTVCLVDAEALRPAMPEADWYGTVFDTGRDDDWFTMLDSPDHLVEGAANLTLPLATGRENIVLARAGLGDGCFPLLACHDAAGGLLSVHVDLLVERRAAPAVEDDPDDLPTDDSARESLDEAPARPAGDSWWRRLLG